MNLGQLKDKTLQLIREYSNNGAIIGTGDNADYLLSINGLISDAQIEIAKKRPIIEDYELPVIPFSETQNYKVYKKPLGAKNVIGLFINFIEPIHYEENYLYILVDKYITGTKILKYEKAPTILNKDTPNSQELEIEEEYQHICCYKAASHIIIDENPDISNALKEEYNRLLFSIEPNDSLYVGNGIKTLYTGGW